MPDPAPGRPPGRAARLVSRRPRLWGALFAALLLAFYLVAFRPARLWTAAHVARPLFEAVDTPRARAYVVAMTPTRPDAVYAVPRAQYDGRDLRQLAREGGTAEWAAPVGVLFLLPAMFLLVAFPTRPFWLVLLGYHLAVGVLSTAVFAVGLGWFEPAFRVYLFTRTYLTESVSLVVPLLLYLAARGAGPLAPRRPDREAG
ncbi:MAG TPA: hypothetical protein VF576_08565 [Rubricoccaceae bacterium]